MGVSLRVGDKVTTDFRKEEKDRIRIITRIRQYPSQSGMMIETDYELELDAGWFKKVK